jgi:hypothetical protein
VFSDNPIIPIPRKGRKALALTPGLGRYRPGQQLVDIAFALVVVGAAPDVGHLQGNLRGEFPLYGHVPRPGGSFEDGILHGDVKGKVAPLSAPRRVHDAVDDRLLLRKRWITSQRDITIDGSAIQEHPCARPHGRLLVQGVGQAQPWLKAPL